MNGFCPLPPKNHKETCQFPPCLPNIGNHHHPVVVRCGEDTPKVFKFGHHIHRTAVGLEGHCRDFLCFLFPLPRVFFGMYPCRTLKFPNASCSAPPREETYIILVIVEEGGYPPPGPILFPARGSARSGPRGCSNSLTSPFTLPLGM